MPASTSKAVSQGAGLSEKQISHCDSLIYIPQHGPGTASLNVAVAASIVLHHFAIWAGMPERERTGPKYNVAPRPQRIGAKGERLQDVPVQRNAWSIISRITNVLCLPQRL